MDGSPLFMIDFQFLLFCSNKLEPEPFKFKPREPGWCYCMAWYTRALLVWYVYHTLVNNALWEAPIGSCVLKSKIVF